ncbi:MAG: hypothetical protein IJX17_03445 [Clostridia bacterium]|nr:hypothetical protein [Clostridia bacterium]
MGGVQILKLVFFGLVVGLAIACFVITFMLGKAQNIDYRDRKVRLLLRVRAILFVVMLVLLFIIVVIT